MLRFIAYLFLCICTIAPQAWSGDYPERKFGHDLTIVELPDIEVVTGTYGPVMIAYGLPLSDRRPWSEIAQKQHNIHTFSITATSSDQTILKDENIVVDENYTNRTGYPIPDKGIMTYMHAEKTKFRKEWQITLRPEEGGTGTTTLTLFFTRDNVKHRHSFKVTFLAPDRIKYLAAGHLTKDHVLYSHNGINWASNSDENIGKFTDFVQIDGSLIGVALDRIATSRYGINWQPITQDHKKLRAIIREKDLLVAVGDNSRIVTSRDGKNWTKQDSQSEPIHYRDIAFGNGVFVAIGHFYDNDSIEDIAALKGVISISADGANWEPIPIPPLIAPHRIMFDGEKFIAVGAWGGGRSWKVLYDAFSNFRQVRTGKGLFLYFISTLSASIIMENDLYEKVPNSVGPSILTSFDGRTWDVRNYNPGSRDLPGPILTSIVRGKNEYLAIVSERGIGLVYDEYETRISCGLMRSSDAEIWIKRTFLSIDNCDFKAKPYDMSADLIFDGEKYIVAAPNYDAPLAISYDGNNWENLNSKVNFRGTEMLSTIYQIQQ